MNKMNTIVKNMAVDIINDAIHNSQRLREKIVKFMNSESISVVDGVIALLLLAAGNAKESGLPRSGFLFMCEKIYDATSVSPEGDRIINFDSSESQDSN